MMWGRFGCDFDDFDDLGLVLDDDSGDSDDSGPLLVLILVIWMMWDRAGCDFDDFDGLGLVPMLILVIPTIRGRRWC